MKSFVRIGTLVQVQNLYKIIHFTSHEEEHFYEQSKITYIYRCFVPNYAEINHVIKFVQFSLLGEHGDVSFFLREMRIPSVEHTN